MENFDIFGKIQTVINEDISNMLKDISLTYKLDYAELKQKYSPLNKQNAIETVVDEPKKRGRKKKIKEEFVEAEEFVYKDITYLVDGKNIVYTNSLDMPTIIGEKLVDGTIKFYKS
jgi:hypothetical protein